MSQAAPKVLRESEVVAGDWTVLTGVMVAWGQSFNFSFLPHQAAGLLAQSARRVHKDRLAL